jgi:hypothetical protein
MTFLGFGESGKIKLTDNFRYSLGRIEKTVILGIEEA